MHADEKGPNSIGSFDDLHDRAVDALSRGRLTEAESLAVAANGLQKDHVGILNVLGQVYLAQKRASDASVLFSRAVELQPRRPNLLFNLALAQQAEGRIPAAIQSVRSAISLDPSTPILHAKLGQLLAMGNDPLEAVKVLRQALKMDAKSVPVRLNLAQALTDLGQVTEAESITRAALFLNPKDPTAHRMLGRIHQLNGRFDDAATSLRTSIALQPVQAAAYFALAYSKSITSGDRDTMQRMEELLTAPGLTESDRAQLHYALGKGFDDLGEFYAAMSHFDRANEIAVNSALPFDPAFETKKVDRLIELFPKDRFAKWPGVGSQSNRPIFIVGMIRSGTTLVEQILSRHPDVSPAGELRFWVENEPRFLVDMVSGPDSAPDCPSWRVDYEAELDRVSVSARRITDKMPLNFWAIGLIHIAYPEAKIVHCRRNPLDTCLSIYVTPFRRAPEFGHSRSNIASAYREYFRLMEHWRSVIPTSSLIEVDYEQLVSNPETKARELIQACDLDWCDSCLDPAQSSNPVNTPSQWQVRQPVYRGSVDRWRSYAEWLGPIRELADL